MSESTPSNLSSKRNEWLGILGLVVVLVMHAGIVHDLIKTQTPTLDEVAHLPAGQSYLDKLTFRMYRHSPPGARLLAALASTPAHLEVPYGGGWRTDEPANHWRFAFETIEAHATSPQRQQTYLTAFTWGRHATLAWSLAGMVVLYVWVKKSFGPAAGLVSAGLWAFCPNMLAHASLVTTDMAATSAGLCTLFAFACWIDRPSWSRLVLVAITLGIAQWVKHSSLWLYPMIAGWVVIEIARQRVTWSKGTMGLAGMVIGSIVVLNAGYLFEGTGTPLGSFPFLSQSLTRDLASGEINTDIARTNNVTYRDVWTKRVNRFRGTMGEFLPVPVPYHYLAGFDEQKFEAEGKYPMYLQGRFADPLPSRPGEPTLSAAPQRRGWWYYYLYALAVKIPLSTWLLVVWGTVTALRARPWQAVEWLILAAIPLGAMSFLTDINLGLRYVLPTFPFLFALAGATASSGWLARLAVAFVFGWNGWTLIALHPNELAFFNEAVGGPVKGRFHLIDSNLDWGQDLRRLGRWLERHPEWREGLVLAYAGTVPPEFEGMNSLKLPPRDLRFVPEFQRFAWERIDRPETWGPLPGKYAVSVNFERGMRFHTPLPFSLREQRALMPGAMLGGSMMANMPRGSLAYFQYFEPRIEPEIGYSILLFDITKQEANRVRREMGISEIP